jgi:hypothetical protein
LPPPVRARLNAKGVHSGGLFWSYAMEFATGSVATKASVWPGVIANWAFGLRVSDANLARNFLPEIPAEAVSLDPTTCHADASLRKSEAEAFVRLKN